MWRTETRQRKKARTVNKELYKRFIDKIGYHYTYFDFIHLFIRIISLRKCFAIIALSKQFKWSFQSPYIRVCKRVNTHRGKETRTRRDEMRRDETQTCGELSSDVVWNAALAFRVFRWNSQHSRCCTTRSGEPSKEELARARARSYRAD